MKKDNYLFKLLILFLTFMKIGVFTFGGGYAMIPIIEEEVTKKRKWISEMEIMDILAISESTPGPIAVNTATYVGYKVAGVAGGIIATISLAIPSFVIIFVISFFYQDFMQWPVIAAMFKGLKVGVIILLFSAVLKLKKGVKVNLVGIILFVTALSLMLVFSFIDTGFKYLSLCLILLGIITGIVLTLIGKNKEEQE
ncbi:MAG: chromate transporter [Bacilli bacterium]|nr:chromate transporter [Bacilli bacterium]